MIITLDNTDVEAALIAYVRNMGIDTFNCDFEIQTTKGRKTSDLIANINIVKREAVPSQAENTIEEELEAVVQVVQKEVGARDEVETTRPLFNRPDPLIMGDEVPDEDDVEEGRSTGLNFLS